MVFVVDHLLFPHQLLWVLLASSPSHLPPKRPQNFPRWWATASLENPRRFRSWQRPYPSYARNEAGTNLEGLGWGMKLLDAMLPSRKMDGPIYLLEVETLEGTSKFFNILVAIHLFFFWNSPFCFWGDMGGIFHFWDFCRDDDPQFALVATVPCWPIFWSGAQKIT